METFVIENRGGKEGIGIDAEMADLLMVNADLGCDASEIPGEDGARAGPSKG